MKTRIKNFVLPRLRAHPDFLIIGAQKAGTTSLHRYLAEHPDLRPASGSKELHYFYLYYHRGPAWYLSHFPFRFAMDDRLNFEATPDYLSNAVVPGRMRRDLGRVKLIMVLREPAARAYSAWKMWHSFADIPDKAARADRRSFVQAIEEEMADPTGQSHLHFHYLSMGRYADHLEAYRQHFPTEDILILNYAEMSVDLGSFLERICVFLGVKPFPAQVVERLGEQRHWVGPSWPKTEEVVRTQERLRDYYAPHNARLFALLDQEWDWNRRTCATVAEATRASFSSNAA